MSDDYDLGQILDAIRRRVERLSRNGVAVGVGDLMVRAARDFIRLPSLDTLHSFRVLEDEWRARQPTARRRFANAFADTLGIESPAPPKYAGYTPYNKDWNPARGFVYGFWSHDHHGIVKLGATTKHPQDRLEHFNRKYQLKHLAIAFFFEVTRPAEVERYWTDSLKTYHCSMGSRGSREWYSLNPREAKQHVLAAIQNSRVQRLPVSYVLKSLDAWKEIDFWPQGPRRFGAHIVPRQN